MKKIAVILSGCGHRDGAEITESASALIALSEVGAKVRIFAPRISFEVIDHTNADETKATRNVFVESARIARGEIEDLAHLQVSDFDALVFPGGSGAAIHLCNFAANGAKADVLDDVARVVRTFHEDSKPICAICIAPAILACVLGRERVTITLGSDEDMASEIEKTGAIHEKCAVEDFITDRHHKIISTPAYMFEDATPYQVFTGIRRAIRETVEMA